MDSTQFTKMSGAGNDFILLDYRDKTFSLTAKQIEHLCHRRFGIGADGVIAVERSPDPAQADFRMRYYNADGGEAEMCGNGARCFARYVQHWPRARASSVRFSTLAGIITGEYLEQGVRVGLTSPTEAKLNQVGDFGWGEIVYHSLNTGVPHVVIFVDEAASVAVVEQGRAIRRHPIFPRGTNVNFVQVGPDHLLVVRTYERGVEDETLACGTGVTASALLAHLVKEVPLPAAIRVRSGDLLQVDARCQRDGGTLAFKQVTLTGPALVTFTGQIVL